MAVSYDLDKIKYATEPRTFERGVKLYKGNKVSNVEEALGDYTALVQGTQPYRVSISGRRYQDAFCECYVGQQGNICKHVVALALHVVLDGRPLSVKDQRQTVQIECSRRRSELSEEELAAIRKLITDSLKYIKTYHGPSRTWFANQSSLQEGCQRLRAIVSDFPIHPQTAGLLVNLLGRLDRKLIAGGVDDSNGIVGSLIREIVALLEEFARIDQDCIVAFKPLTRKESSFGWEDSLIQIYNSSKN